MISGTKQENFWSKDEWLNDFSHRRQSLKVAAGRRAALAAEAFRNIVIDLAPLLRVRGENAAVDDLRSYLRHGVAYTPSLLTRTLLAAADKLEAMSARLSEKTSISGLVGPSPRDIFRMGGIEL